MIKEYTIQSNNKKDAYSVILFFIEGNLIPEKCSCTCRFGSFYRFTQENKKKNKWECVHIKEAIRRYKNGKPDNIERGKKTNGETKPIYPIFQQGRSQ